MRLLVLFTACISLISLVANLYFLREQQKQNVVAEVVDGDTFQLVSGKRVRLAETVQESFGRSLALVFVDGELINKTMMAAGWGRPDYRKNSHRDTLTAAFHDAQKRQAGIWSGLCRTTKTTGACRIKGNIDKSTYDRVYHLPGCR